MKTPIIRVDKMDFGLNKRETVAAMALQGILSGYWGNPECGAQSPIHLARQALDHADALLKLLDDEGNDDN